MPASNQSVPINPAEADIQIEVDDNGVYLGFFTNDGQMSLVNVEKLAKQGFGDFIALASWCADRRRQAQVP